MFTEVRLLGLAITAEEIDTVGKSRNGQHRVCLRELQHSTEGNPPQSAFMRRAQTGDRSHGGEETYIDSGL